MTLQTSTLVPGLLVSLKTSITGNVKYNKQTIEENHVIETGAARERWETERLVSDPAEHERSQKARSAIWSTMKKVCSKTEFGLLCPQSRAEALERAIVTTRKLADEFNETSNLTRLGVYVITGRVADTDVEAVRAINSEVRDMIDVMQEGLRNLDVKSVRAAASKLQSVGQMLTADASEKVKSVIAMARKTAREIVKAGEGVAAEIDLVTIKKLAEQRTAFLDLDEVGEVAAPVGTGRAVEFAPAAPSETPAAKPSVPQFEM